MKHKLFIFSLAHADNSCEHLMNSNYDIKSYFNSEEFEYIIKSKDGKPIKFYKDNNPLAPAEIGLIINDEKPLKDNEISKNLEERYREFFFEKNVYSSNLFREHVSTLYTIPISDDFFIKNPIITNKINIKEFVNFLKEKIPPNDRTEIKNLTFKVKIVLDPQINSCIVFKLNPIEYDFIEKSDFLSLIKNVGFHVKEFLKICLFKTILFISSWGH